MIEDTTGGASTDVGGDAHVRKECLVRRPDAKRRMVHQIRANLGSLLASVAQYESLDVDHEGHVVTLESEAEPLHGRSSDSDIRHGRNSIDHIPTGTTHDILSSVSVTPPASQKAISQLPRARVLPIHQQLALNAHDECGVCCDRLVNGVMVTKLPCGHVYHLNCVVPWLQTNCSCPECRYELPTDNPCYEVARVPRMAAAYAAVTRRQFNSCDCQVVHHCFFVMPPTDNEMAER